MPFNFKIKKYESLSDLSSQLEAVAEEIGRRISAVESPPTSFEDRVLLHYIEVRSTAKVASAFKELGVRSASGTVYAASDVPDLIREGYPTANAVLLRMAREIFNKNSEAVIRAYG